MSRVSKTVSKRFIECWFLSFVFKFPQCVDFGIATTIFSFFSNVFKVELKQPFLPKKLQILLNFGGFAIVFPF